MQKINITNREKLLIKNLKNKDESAFSELIDLNLPKVINGLRKKFDVSDEDFDDAIQLGLYKAWKNIESFREESLFSSWLYIIIKNELLSIINSVNRIGDFEVKIEDIKSGKNSANHDYDILDYESVTDETILETAQTILEKREKIIVYKEILEKVFQKLKPDHGKVLHLALNEGKSYEEIAQELEIPIGTVMSRIHFARQNAQRLIKQYAKLNDIELSFK